jgi:membrane protein required for colicin V production
MSVVDTLVLGTLAIGLVLGLLRGLVPQMTGVVGVLGGLLLAGRYHGPLRASLIDPLLGTSHNGEIAFVLIVVLCVVVTACFGWALGRMIEKLQLGAYDRLLGAAFGVAKAGLLCAGILLAVVYFAPNGGGIERSIGSSRAGPAIWEALDGAVRYLPEGVRGDVLGFLRKNALPSPRETADGGGE